MRPMYLGLVFSTHIQRHKTGTSLIPFPSLSLRLYTTSSSIKFQGTVTRLYVHMQLCMHTCNVRMNVCTRMYVCVHVWV